MKLRELEKFLLKFQRSTGGRRVEKLTKFSYLDKKLEKLCDANFSQCKTLKSILEFDLTLKSLK